MTQNKPLVSVIIPTFNHAEFIGNAINSVIHQTYTNWELVIVNNYSSDNTIEIIESYKETRIKLINFKNNGVIAASRNIGIANSVGDYVSFLDSDDVWYPEKLEKCIALMNQGCDLVCHGEVWKKEGKPARKVIYGPKSRSTYNSLLFRGNCISTSATMVRRSILESTAGFNEDPDIVTAEDYDLWLRIADITQRICFINEMLGDYIIHNVNMSKAIGRNMQAEMSVIKSHFDKLKNKGISNHLLKKRRIALALYGAGRAYQSNDKYSDSLKMYFKAFFTSPFILRMYIAFSQVVLNIFIFGLFRHERKKYL